MKASIILTSAELMQILKNKYPDLDIGFIWFDLQETNRGKIGQAIGRQKTVYLQLILAIPD